MTSKCYNCYDVNLKGDDFVEEIIKRLTVRIPFELLRDLKIIAAKKDSNVNKLVTEGIEYIIAKYLK